MEARVLAYPWSRFSCISQDLCIDLEMTDILVVEKLVPLCDLLALLAAEQGRVQVPPARYRQLSNQAT